MEWGDLFDQLREHEDECSLCRDLLIFYDARLPIDTSEKRAYVVIAREDSQEGGEAEQVGQALRAGDAAALTRYASRATTNGTPYSDSPGVLYTDASTMRDLLDGDVPTAARRYLCGQACLLALSGVVGISFEALLGVRGAPEMSTVLKELLDENSLRHRIASRFLALLNLRRTHSAFEPGAGQTVLNLNPAVFALERLSPDGRERVVALHNVSEQVASVEFSTGGVRRWRNLQIDEPVDIPAVFTYRIVLSPYQYAWLRAE